LLATLPLVTGLSCHHVGPVDGDGGTDAGTDTGEPWDPSCPGPVEGPCDGDGELQIVFDSGETSHSDDDHDVRFVELLVYDLGGEHLRAAVLAEVELGPGDPLVVVYAFDLDENGLGGAPQVGHAEMLDFYDAYHSFDIARPSGGELTENWELFVLVCQYSNLDCFLGGVPAGLGTGQEPIEQLGSLYGMGYDPPAGLSALGGELLIFGNRLWGTLDGAEWYAVDGVGDGPLLHEVATLPVYDGRAFAVGQSGRMLVYGASFWSELDPLTGESLVCAGIRSGPDDKLVVAAAGTGGVLLHNTGDDAAVCECLDDDITAIDWVDTVPFGTLLTVGTVTGELIDLGFLMPSCLAASQPDPILAVHNLYVSECLVTLVLTEDALFASSRYCVGD
jgi:hypothetical protein